MTEWMEPDHFCEDCDEHTGTACMNRNSDHYAHYTLPVHPACDDAVILEETEYVHHVHCDIHSSKACNCRV